MENIDNKIDILMRQKLLMNYNPSMNLDENINAYAKKDLILESRGQVLRNIFNWVKSGGGGLLKGIRKSLGFIWGLAPKSITIPLMLYAASRFIRRSGRQDSVDKIKDLFDTCHYLNEQPGAQHKKSAKDLVYAFKKGWKIAGLGVDVNGVINIFKRSYKWGDFCKRNKAYNDEYARNSGKELFDELTSFDNFDATNRVDRLWEEALSKVEANFYEGAAQVTPPEGSSTTPDAGGTGTTPPEGSSTTPDAGGTGTTPPRRFCPNGYSAPTDGVYKKCTMGKPVGTLQACLGGLTVDEKFGPRTQKALENKTGFTKFREDQLPQICPPVANIEQQNQTTTTQQQQNQTTTTQQQQVDSEYQMLTRVPIDGAPIRKKF